MECMAVGYAISVINAIRERKLSSKVRFAGILRKLTIFDVVEIKLLLLCSIEICQTSKNFIYTNG